MSRGRLRRALPAGVLAVLLGVPAFANPSLNDDFQSMSQWLSHELAQGLAFNAGSTFDPPKPVKGYALQPDVSLGVGRMPLDKRDFPSLETPALQGGVGAAYFPDSVLFPNLALHLRLGLPWGGDAYVRLADATIPAGYRISPSLTAAVQTNSYGAGVRQHFFGGDGHPTLTLGAHYNHVQGRAALKGKLGLNIGPDFSDDSEIDGDIRWSVNSYGLTAVLQKDFGRWTPFGGFGYNYATGSVSTSLDLKPQSFLLSDVHGVGSDRPEKSQGRWIFGFQYARPTWSLFANAELKAIGQIQYRSFIAQFGAALPFEIGRGPAIFYRKRPRPARPVPAPPPARAAPADVPKSVPQNAPRSVPQTSSEFIFLH